jgi:hypothetical protein
MQGQDLQPEEREWCMAWGYSGSERNIRVDKACRSRYYSHTISVRFTVISTHKTSGAHLDTSHNLFIQGTEANQLGMSSGLQQYPQPLKQGRTLYTNKQK